jgi:hypothetical protein
VWAGKPVLRALRQGRYGLYSGCWPMTVRPVRAAKRYRHSGKYTAIVPTGSTKSQTAPPVEL